MSLIHKALRQAERASNSSPKNNYNPLSAPQQPANTALSPLVIVGGLLIWAAIAVVAWPVSESDVLLTDPPLAETSIQTEAQADIGLGPNNDPTVEPVLAAALVADAPAAAQLIVAAGSTQLDPTEPLAVDTALTTESDADQTARVNSQINAGLRAIAMAVAPRVISVEPIVKPAVKPVVKPVVESVLESVLESVVESVVKPVVESAVEPIRPASNTIATAPSSNVITLKKPAPTVAKATAPVVQTAKVRLAPLPATKAVAVPVAAPSAPTANTPKKAAEATSSASDADPAATLPPRASVIQDSKNLWQQQVEQAVSVGAIEQAEAILKQWLGAAPNDPVPRIWLARIYIGNGFYRAAEPLLSNPTDSETKALLGLVYERTARPQLAAELFEELYRVSPENGRWLLFWAINSENSGQLAKSRTLYQTYLTLFGSEDETLTQFSQQRLTTIGTL